MQDRLYEKLSELKIEFIKYEHIPVFTCEDAEKVYTECEPFGHCKNLFVKDKKKNYWLIVAMAETVVKLKDISKVLDIGEMRLASPESLLEVLKVEPGSVTPFALINNLDKSVRVLVDPSIMNQEKIGFHPLKNDATLVITPAELRTFLDSCEHEIRSLPII